MVIRLIVALLIGLFAAHPSWAILRGSGGAVCTTPADGDLFNEGFVGTGYEGGGWAETIGATGVVDEDHTLSGTPPSGSCTEGLMTSVNTSGGVTYTTKTITSQALPVDIYVEFYIESVTIPTNFGSIEPMAFFAGGTNIASVTMFRNDPNYTFRMGTASQVPVSLQVWHTYKIHLDSTANSCYSQLDGGSQVTFTSNSIANLTLLHFGIKGLLDAGDAANIEWGRIWASTP